MSQHNATLQNPFNYQPDATPAEPVASKKSGLGAKLLSILVAWGERVYEYRSTDSYQQYSRVRRYL